GEHSRSSGPSAAPRLRPTHSGGCRPQPAQPTIALSGRRSPDEERLIIETDTLHGDVIAGTPAYQELENELVAATLNCPEFTRERPACGPPTWRPRARVMTMSSPVIRWTGCFNSPGFPTPTSRGRCCGSSSRQGGEPS